MPIPLADLLPCPLNTGWELVERVVLQQTVPLPAEWHLASGQGLRTTVGRNRSQPWAALVSC